MAAQRGDAGTGGKSTTGAGRVCATMIRVCDSAIVFERKVVSNGRIPGGRHRAGSAFAGEMHNDGALAAEPHTTRHGRDGGHPSTVSILAYHREAMHLSPAQSYMPI